MKRTGTLVAIVAAVVVLAVGGWLVLRDPGGSSSTPADAAPTTTPSPSASTSPLPTELPATPALPEVKDFGSNPGDLVMYEYAPPELPRNPAAVVVLHGCGMSSAEMAGYSAWRTMADRFGFYLLLPQSAADPNAQCYGFDDTDTLRGGGGDADSVHQMVTWAQANRGVDPSRVYVTGFSGGAMFTNVMLGAYPDDFEAGGSQSGIPYRCADDARSLMNCGFKGKDLSPVAWGDRAREANPGSWTWPRMVVVNGSADQVSNPVNLTEQMEQWTDLNGVDQEADVSDCVDGFPHQVYENAAGTSRVETYSITDGNHNLYVTQDAPAGACGKAPPAQGTVDAPYCSAYWIGRFFGVVTGPVTTERC